MKSFAPARLLSIVCTGTAAGILLLTGCSASGHEKSHTLTGDRESDSAKPSKDSPHVDPDPKIVNPLPSLRLPIQNYMESDELRHQASLAVTKLATACLESGGLHFRPGPSSYQEPPSLMAGRYGPVNLQQAKYGYHFMTAIQDVKAARVQPSKSELSRVNTCFSSAESTIPEPGQGDVINKIKDDGWVQAMSLPAVQASFLQWSKCMAAAGYDYSTPQAVMQEKSWDWKSDKPSAREISVATRDVTCKEESGTVEAWFSGESSLEKKAIGLHRQELDKTSAQLKAKATVVSDILSG
ncbi:hypothetical protein [Streptomyces sp. NPDC049040]|uniref:hypothetical protein n=1 Tax=Streptomyces sp. NPDC049040 TaxID=3365593 RepID=UPI003721B252